MYQQEAAPKKSNKSLFVILGGIALVIVSVLGFQIFSNSSSNSAYAPAQGTVGQTLEGVDFFPETSQFGTSVGSITIHSAVWKRTKLFLDVEVTATEDRASVSSAYFYGERDGMIYNYEVMPDVDPEFPTMETLRAGESTRGIVVLEPNTPSLDTTGPIQVTMTNATMSTPLAHWIIAG